ncbi:MAG: methionine adenosyltransferase domain-containing protein, partial [Armatimonadota bacterium]
IKHLDLRQPMYERTAAYGHFGRTDLDVPWERTDMADMLRREAGL